MAMSDYIYYASLQMGIAKLIVQPPNRYDGDGENIKIRCKTHAHIHLHLHKGFVVSR